MNRGQLVSLTYCDKCRTPIEIHPHWKEVKCKNCGTVNNLVMKDFWCKRDNTEVRYLTEDGQKDYNNNLEELYTDIGVQLFEEHCDWCSGDKVKTSKDSWDEKFLYIDSSELHIEGETACGWENVGFSVDLPIKFCPNCGRKLD